MLLLALTTQEIHGIARHNLLSLIHDSSALSSQSVLLRPRNANLRSSRYVTVLPLTLIINIGLCCGC